VHEHRTERGVFDFGERSRTCVSRLPQRDARIDLLSHRAVAKNAVHASAETNAMYAKARRTETNEATRTKIAAPLTSLLDNTYVPDAYELRVASPNTLALRRTDRRAAIVSCPGARSAREGGIDAR